MVIVNLFVIQNCFEKRIFCFFVSFCFFNMVLCLCCSLGLVHRIFHMRSYGNSISVLNNNITTFYFH